ncbi:MAG: hypothetical protein ABJG14_21915 [Sulfitobacter sp.]|uniref:hypothetical protein n=1 Tax=Alphaproteobacteria TaxID=28211 RepID=UPI003265C5C0
MSYEPPRAFGDRSSLTFDQLDLLENKVLPTARRWLRIPSLADHAKQTLAYWGEVPPAKPSDGKP